MKDAVILHQGCWWKGWGVKDEAVILHSNCFRSECAEGLGIRLSSFTGDLVEGMGREG